MKKIRYGIGFATGRKSFKKVLGAYIQTWLEAKKKLPPDYEVSLSLFVAYDLDYLSTQSTDYTNLSQEIVDQFDNIIFLGAKNALRSIERLEKGGVFTKTELRSVFGSGYAGKRNAILYAALDNQIDYLLFLDDDEYPLAVTANSEICLWSGQHVMLSHLLEITNADYTNGHHCGYVSPIPQIRFNEQLTEADFQAFIEAISNDIISWESMKRLMESGGVTYASKEVLTQKQKMDVPEIHGCKFISGANLCINLTNPGRTFPFYNPPGARGEDTFLSTLLHDRTVRQIPCYAFHDGFSTYKHILDGALPTQLAPITAESRAVVTRFLGACTGWVRYKPLLVYLTKPEAFEREMAHMQKTLSEVLPKFAAYAEDDGFLAIEGEFLKYRKNVAKHAAQLHLAKATWKKLLEVIAAEDR
ncbi:hypothetical protein SDC9_80135 [bioreactor metagenome]|uniref:Uncharacterized protein n=1 Tax=bioreactor metagenome TaxID=1076179 RepID=A0A644YZ33_9ZZZZ